MRGKYSFTKLAFSHYCVIRVEMVTTFGSNAQGYIYRTLQHFATKFWNFTTFEMFFLGTSLFVGICLDQKLVYYACKLSIAFL